MFTVWVILVLDYFSVFVTVLFLGQQLRLHVNAERFLSIDRGIERHIVRFSTGEVYGLDSETVWWLCLLPSYNRIWKEWFCVHLTHL